MDQNKRKTIRAAHRGAYFDGFFAREANRGRPPQTSPFISPICRNADQHLGRKLQHSRCPATHNGFTSYTELARG